MFKSLNVSKVIKNSGYLLNSEIISKFLYFILIVFISRSLGVKGLGAYGFVFAFLGLILIFSDLGQQVFIRELIINKKALHRFWGNLLFLKFFNSLVVYAITIIITLTPFIPSELKIPLRLTGLILFWDVPFKTARSIFIAHQKVKLISFIGVAGDLLFILLSLFYVLSGKGVSWIVISFAIGSLIKAVMLNFLLIKKFSKPSLRIDLKLCTKWMKEGFYFIMQRQFREGLSKVNILVISLIGSLYAAGLYQAPYKIVLNTEIISPLFGMVLYPYYININQTSFKRLKSHYKKYKSYIAIASIGLCLFLFVFSKQIILLLFGGEFIKSVLILRILAISTLFFSLNSNNLALLNALKKEKLCFYLLGSIFLLNLLLDIILIKYYGIIGVATANVICAITLFIITESCINNFIKKRCENPEII